MDTTNQLNERNEASGSREILVKTEGNKSLRLNATPKPAGNWEVTIPFQAPVILINNSGNWSAQDGDAVSDDLIRDIGKALEKL